MMWDLPMRNGLSRRCPRDHVELTKTIRNKLTADRSTTELRWIVLSLRLSEAYILPTLCQRASFCFAANPLQKRIAGKINELRRLVSFTFIGRYELDDGPNTTIVTVRIEFLSLFRVFHGHSRAA
jgi:hypothetical protein